MTARGVALEARHSLQEVERDRFFLLECRSRNYLPPAPARRCATLAGEPSATEREAWQLEGSLHAALATSAAYVPESFGEWRARALEAPGCGPATVLVSRTPAGALAGICALRICAADPATAYHAFTGVAAAARGQGHGRALKLAAIARARELGVRHMVADTSPANSAMLSLNERLGYRAVLDVRNLEGSP